MSRERDFALPPSNTSRPPLVWKDLITITDSHNLTDWAIRVQTNESGRPRYSSEFGKVRDGKFLRFISFDLQTFDGVVSVTPLDFMTLLPLLEMAQEAVRNDAQRREDEFHGQRGRRDFVPRPAAPQPLPSPRLSAPRVDDRDRGREGGRPDRRSKIRGSRRSEDQRDW